MAKFKGPNAKQEAGRDKKAANAAVKQAAKDKAREETEAQEWKKGSNVRGAAKSAAVAQKADEAARKRAEKAALLAAEEEESGSFKPKKNLNRKSNKKKAKNELSLLEEALVGDAEKKSKAAKRADRLKKEREDRLRQEREKKRAQEAKNLDPLLANTDAMIGIGSTYATDNGETSGGGALNAPLSANEAAGTGIDSALSALSVGKADDQHPEKRMRALHAAFEEKLMPEMKRDYPGLKRSQYKEKIFAVWKKSPENPMNWPQQS